MMSEFRYNLFWYLLCQRLYVSMVSKPMGKTLPTCETSTDSFVLDLYGLLISPISLQPLVIEKCRRVLADGYDRSLSSPNSDDARSILGRTDRLHCLLLMLPGFPPRQPGVR